MSSTIKDLRMKLGLTQEEFSDLYHFSLRTVQMWEQRRREPRGAAKILLDLIVRYPAKIARLIATGKG